jgi:anti-sigma factor RsiW
MIRLKSLAEAFATIAGRHPRLAELLAYRDGELELRRLGQVSKHVSGCSRCREALARLSGALDECTASLKAVSASAAPPAGLDEILGIMHDDALIAAAQVRLEQERDTRLAAQLRPFFGAHSDALLRRTDGSSFRAEAEWLLRAFLGRRAASDVLRSIEAENGAA